jgi:AraC-like DNA-binding protein
MPNSDDSQESVIFQRRCDFPGVEVRTVPASSASWRSYSAEYEFMHPQSWRGEVWHRQHRETLEPGWVLCAQPGEVYRATRVHTPGTRSCLVIDADVLSTYAEEHGLAPQDLSLRSVVWLSEPLRGRLSDMVQALQPARTLLETEATMVAFVAALVEGLVDRTPLPRTEPAWSNRAAERARACLHDTNARPVDLRTLAAQVGLSRFQALRAFKRHYGMPPHAYQLRVRVGLAQRSLRAGGQPAQVAAEYGFVDQSHLTRHFKRLVGVTPAQYQRVGAVAH